MLSLWSRATRTRSSCHCISCLSATTTTGRRLATNAGRRQLRFGDYVYMFSTGIFASAAVADANLKEKRRNDLDTAIAEQRGKLGAWQDSPLLIVGNGMVDGPELDRYTEGVEDAANDCPNNGTSSLGSSGPTKHQERFRDYKSRLRTTHWGLPAERGELGPARTQVFTDPVGTPRNQSIGSNTELYTLDWSEEYFRTVFSGRTVLKDHPDTPQWSMRHFAPQSIYAEEPSTVKPKHIWGSKKLRTVELSIFKLVHRLLLRLGPFGVGGLTALRNLLEATSHRDLSRELAFLKYQLCLLMFKDQVVESPPSPRYNQDGDGNFRWETRELNLSITSLFNRHLAGSLGFRTLITRLCYNLLACNAPPDINTYNLIIYFLSKLPQTRSLAGPMVQPVIDSLLETKIRPNETTYCLILRHYTNVGDEAGLTKFVRLMVGHDEGLMLARPGIRITDAGAPRLIRRANKVIQVPTFDRDTFAALIRSTLRFSGIEAAMRVFKSMQMDGWCANLEILYTFLKACTQIRDWEGGKAVWDEIIARFDAKHLDTKTYQWMLSLCWRCAKSNEFKELYQEALALGHRASDLLKYVTGAEPSQRDPWSPIRPHGTEKAEKESQCSNSIRTSSRQSPVSTVGETRRTRRSMGSVMKQTVNPQRNSTTGQSIPISQFQQTPLPSVTWGKPVLENSSQVAGTQLAWNYNAFNDVVLDALDTPQPALPTESEHIEPTSIPEDLYQFVVEAALAPFSLRIRQVDYQLLIIKHCLLEIHAARTRRELFEHFKHAVQAVVANVLSTEQQLCTLEILFTKRAIRRQAAKVFVLDLADEVTKSGLSVASLALDHINIHEAISGCSPQSSEMIYYCHAHKETALLPVTLPSSQRVDSWNTFKEWKKTFVDQDWTWFARQRIKIGFFAMGISRKTIDAPKLQAIDTRIPPRDRIYFRGDKTMKLLAELRDYALSYGLTMVEENGGFVISRPVEMHEENRAIVRSSVVEVNKRRKNEAIVRPSLMELKRWEENKAILTSLPMELENPRDASDADTQDWSGPLPIKKMVLNPGHVPITNRVPKAPVKLNLENSKHGVRRRSSVGYCWSPAVPEVGLGSQGAARNSREPVSTAS